MSDDYYEILGVAKNASAEEIQKAYRKKARTYHPDLHEDKKLAKEQFQKVQQAYDVLNDPEKRRMYDQLGPNFQSAGHGPFSGFRGGQPPQGEMEVDWSQLFGGGGPPGGFEEILRQFGGFGQRRESRTGTRPPAPQDLEEEITIPFATAVLGGKHQLSLQRPGGKVENISVNIPVGIEDGKKIRLRGQGAAGRGGATAGDLLIKVKVAKHPHYRRSGRDLHITLPVSLREAALGAKIDLPTPYGTVTVTVPAGSSSGKSLRMKGMGIRPPNQPAGDLLAKLRVDLPGELSEQDRELIKQLDSSWRSFNPRRSIDW